MLTRILQQCLRRMRIFNDFNELTKHDLYERPSVGSELHADLTDRPCCVVAHRDVVGIQVVAKNGHKLAYEWMNMLETSFGEIAEKCERRLTDLKRVKVFS